MKYRIEPYYAGNHIWYIQKRQWWWPMWVSVCHFDTPEDAEQSVCVMLKQWEDVE